MQINDFLKLATALIPILKATQGDMMLSTYPHGTPVTEIVFPNQDRSTKCVTVKWTPEGYDVTYKEKRGNGDSIAQKVTVINDQFLNFLLGGLHAKGVPNVNRIYNQHELSIYTGLAQVFEKTGGFESKFSDRGFDFNVDVNGEGYYIKVYAQENQIDIDGYTYRLSDYHSLQHLFKQHNTDRIMSGNRELNFIL